MASTMGENDESFPEVNVTRQLNLGVPEEFPVDPVSSKLATSKARKEQEEAEAEAEAAKENAGCALTSTLVVSGVVVIAIGVAFIVAKKYRAL